MPSLFASYLRVYEPLTAFDRERQVFWRRYAREGRALGPVEGPVKQRTAVLEALGAGWTRLPDLPDEAYVLERDDTLLVCPWNLRLRVAEAALNARDGVPTRAGRRLRAAGAGRPGQGHRGGLAQRGQGARARGAAGARADRDLGRTAAVVRLRRSGRARDLPGYGRRRQADPALSHGDLQGPPARAPRGLGAAQVARRRPDHRGGRGRHPLARGVPPALDRGAGLRRPGQSAAGATTWPRTIRPGWWPPDSPRCPVATPTRPPRRTRSSSPAGARCSCSSDATDLGKWDERARNGAPGSAPKANTLRNQPSAEA